MLFKWKCPLWKRSVPPRSQSGLTYDDVGEERQAEERRCAAFSGFKPACDHTQRWCHGVLQHTCASLQQQRSWRSVLDVFIGGVRISGSSVSELFRRPWLQKRNSHSLISHPYFVHWMWTLRAESRPHEVLENSRCHRCRLGYTKREDVRCEVNDLSVRNIQSIQTTTTKKHHRVYKLEKSENWMLIFSNATLTYNCIDTLRHKQWMWKNSGILLQL